MPNILRVLLLQLLAVPLAFVLGKSILYWGVGIPTAKEILLLTGKGLFYFSGLHVLLIWPLHQFARKDISQFKDMNLQSLSYFLLVALPLSAFAYLNGNLKSWVDFVELLLVVVPCTWIGAFHYARNQKPYTFSLLVALPSFISLFLLGDIMGPFATRLQFLSDGNYVLLLKLFLSCTAIAFAVLHFGKTEENSPGFFILLLSLSIPALHVATPFLKKGLGIQEIQLLPLHEIYWVGLLAIGLLSRIQLRAADLWVRIWGVGLLGFALFSLTQRVHWEDLQFREIHALSLYYLSVIFVSYLVFRPAVTTKNSSVLRQNVISPH